MAGAAGSKADVQADHRHCAHSAAKEGHVAERDQVDAGHRRPCCQGEERLPGSDGMSVFLFNHCPVQDHMIGLAASQPGTACSSACPQTPALVPAWCQQSMTVGRHMGMHDLSSLSVQDASGASKDEIAAALSTVAAGRIPKDRIALAVRQPPLLSAQGTGVHCMAITLLCVACPA